MGLRHPDEPPAPARLARRRAGEELPERIARDLESRLQTVEAAGVRLRERADEEAVHDLRVAIRRLDAALTLWRPLLRDRARRKARRDLRAMRRALGPIRELEVDTALLREAVPGLPEPSRVVAEQMLVKLERELTAARRVAGKSVSGTRLAGLRRAVATARERVTERVAGAVDDPLRASDAAIQESDREARAALAAGLEHRDDELLHEARIRIKKLRYAIEAIGAVGGERASVAELREIQRALGAAHDHAVLRDRVARRVDRTRKQGAVTGASALLALLEVLERGRSAAIAEARRLAADIGIEPGSGPTLAPATVPAAPALEPPSIRHGIESYLERQLAERDQALPQREAAVDHVPERRRTLPRRRAGARPPAAALPERRHEVSRRRAPDSGDDGDA